MPCILWQPELPVEVQVVDQRLVNVDDSLSSSEYLQVFGRKVMSEPELSIRVGRVADLLHCSVLVLLELMHDLFDELDAAGNALKDFSRPLQVGQPMPWTTAELPEPK